MTFPHFEATKLYMWLPFLFALSSRPRCSPRKQTNNRKQDDTMKDAKKLIPCEGLINQQRLFTLHVFTGWIYCLEEGRAGQSRKIKEWYFGSNSNSKTDQDGSFNCNERNKGTNMVKYLFISQSMPFQLPALSSHVIDWRAYLFSFPLMHCNKLLLLNIVISCGLPASLTGWLAAGAAVPNMWLAYVHKT